MSVGRKCAQQRDAQGGLVRGIGDGAVDCHRCRLNEGTRFDWEQSIGDGDVTRFRLDSQ